MPEDLLSLGEGLAGRPRGIQSGMATVLAQVLPGVEGVNKMLPRLLFGVSWFEHGAHIFIVMVTVTGTVPAAAVD